MTVKELLNRLVYMGNEASIIVLDSKNVILTHSDAADRVIDDMDISMDDEGIVRLYITVKD